MILCHHAPDIPVFDVSWACYVCRDLVMESALKELAKCHKHVGPTFAHTMRHIFSTSNGLAEEVLGRPLTTDETERMTAIRDMTLEEALKLEARDTTIKYETKEECKSHVNGPAFVTASGLVIGEDAPVASTAKHCKLAWGEHDPKTATPEQKRSNELTDAEAFVRAMSKKVTMVPPADLTDMREKEAAYQGALLQWEQDGGMGTPPPRPAFRSPTLRLRKLYFSAKTTVTMRKAITLHVVENSLHRYRAVKRSGGMIRPAPLVDDIRLHPNDTVAKEIRETMGEDFIAADVKAFVHEIAGVPPEGGVTDTAPAPKRPCGVRAGGPEARDTDAASPAPAEALVGAAGSEPSCSTTDAPAEDHGGGAEMPTPRRRTQRARRPTPPREATESSARVRRKRP